MPRLTTTGTIMLAVVAAAADRPMAAMVLATSTLVAVAAALALTPTMAASEALLAFKERFNQHWLLQRHRYATPAQVRAADAPMAEAV